MQRVYTEEEARGRLAAELPFWYTEEGCIRRVYRTGGWKASLMVVNTIGHLAEAAWHHPEVYLSYAAVTVKLMTQKANGITDRDFALARKIEEVVGWQPAKERSPLRGTPNDEVRFKYLEYDEFSRAG
jgi:4a-hydroxytetrahydrobiopterin dehydratase